MTQILAVLCVLGVVLLSSAQGKRKTREVPPGCCPAEEQVFALIKSTVLKPQHCKGSSTCEGSELCCFGFCVPTIHQSQDCCCPVDTIKEVIGRLKECERDTDCTKHERCCEVCEGTRCYSVCRPAVPCPCKGKGMCMCKGDPHCRSYDDHWWHFHGTCEYSFSRDGCINGQPATSLPNFHITIEQFDPSGTWAYVKTVTVDFPFMGFGVFFDENGGVFHVNSNNIHTQIIGNGNYFGPVLVNEFGKYLTAPALGLEKVYFSRMWIYVEVSCWMRERLCGLCADFNDNPTNDRMVGPHLQYCPAVVGSLQPGTLTTDANHFGMSWQVSPPSKTCSCKKPPSYQGRRKHNTDICDVLYEVFERCLEINSVDVKESVASCEYDVSNVGEEMKGINWPCYYGAILNTLCGDMSPKDWEKQLECDDKDG